MSGNPLIGGGYLDNSECAGKKRGLKTGLLHQVGIPEVDIGLFDMPNSYRFDILSLSIFSEISLSISISIFSKISSSISISISIFSRTALSISISILIFSW